MGDQRYVAGVPIPPLTLPQASGGDGTLSYRLTPSVPGLAFAADTRTLSGIPSAADTWTMRYEATDADGDTVGISFSLRAEPLTTLYWSSYSGFERANLDGRNTERLSPTPSIPSAVQVTREHVYWTTYSSGVHAGATIRRADRDGRNSVELVKIQDGLIFDLEIDVARGKMYWTSYKRLSSGVTGKVQRSSLDGTNVVDFFVTDRDRFPLAVAVHGDKVYWTETDTVSYGETALTTLRRANLDGTNVVVLVTGPGIVTGVLGGVAALGLEITDGKMYFVSGEQGNSIARTNLDGSGLESVRERSGFVFLDIALDSDNGAIYWTEASSSEGTSMVRRGGLNGTDVEDIVTAAGAHLIYGIDLDTTSRKIIWTEMDSFGVSDFTYQIREATIDGSSIPVTLVEVTTATHRPAALAVDVLGKKLYWVETMSMPNPGYRIRRAGLDGSGTEELLFRPSVSTRYVVTVRGFALDIVREKVYWVILDGSTSTIERADLDGANREVLVTAANVVLGPIALDVVDAKLFYGHGPTIRRANLDGTGRQDDFLTDAAAGHGFVGSIAIDAVGRNLYWVTDRTFRRANLDGTGQEDLLTDIHADHQLGSGHLGGLITIDAVGRKLYWNGNGTFRRANLDGTGQEDLLTEVSARWIALGTR